MANLINSTDADYNAVSREIQWKADMYLFGNLVSPVEILRSNYLIDASLLEETSADNDLHFGSVTGNEITLTLLNQNGRFSPTNPQSPYFGYMRRGVKVKIYARPGDAFNWDPLGEFYVTAWDATITGTTASITASDKIQSIIAMPPLKLPVVSNLQVKDFYTNIFQAFGVPVTVDTSLTTLLPKAYNVEDNNNLLTALGTGALADCFCDHTGTVVVKSLIAPRQLRATLTDANQIISVEAKQDINIDFDGTSVTCHIPMESDIKNVLSLTELEVPTGTSTLLTMDLSSTPLIRVSHAQVNGTNNVIVSKIAATCTDVSFTTISTYSGEATVALSLFGTIVETVTHTYSDDTSQLLSVSNIYIQSAEYAQSYKEVLDGYVDNPMPILTVQVRGNPLLNLHDKIRIVSDHYNLDFTGIILRQNFTYAGSLSCTLTLLNADVLGV